MTDRNTLERKLADTDYKIRNVCHDIFLCGCNEQNVDTLNDLLKDHARVLSELTRTETLTITRRWFDGEVSVIKIVTDAHQ